MTLQITEHGCSVFTTLLCQRAGSQLCDLSLNTSQGEIAEHLSSQFSNSHRQRLLMEPSAQCLALFREHSQVDTIRGLPLRVCPVYTGALMTHQEQ